MRGFYEAYGQRLEIDKGVLYFSGPLDNPGLQIVAMRKHLQVEAGVEVTGTARNPRVRLVSNRTCRTQKSCPGLCWDEGSKAPGTSDAEKVHVGGHGAELPAGTRRSSNNLATQWAWTRSGSRPRSSGNQPSGVVAVSKRLSDRIYLTYEHGLSAATSIVRISYELTRNWSVRTEAGTAGAVDISAHCLRLSRYTPPFDRDPRAITECRVRHRSRPPPP